MTPQETKPVWKCLVVVELLSLLFLIDTNCFAHKPYFPLTLLGREGFLALSNIKWSSSLHPILHIGSSLSVISMCSQGEMYNAHHPESQRSWTAVLSEQLRAMETELSRGCSDPWLSGVCVCDLFE